MKPFKILNCLIVRSLLLVTWILVLLERIGTQSWVLTFMNILHVKMFQLFKILQLKILIRIRLSFDKLELTRMLIFILSLVQVSHDFRMLWEMRNFRYSIEVDLLIVLVPYLIEVHLHSWLNLWPLHYGWLELFLFRQQSFLGPSSKRLYSDILKIDDLIIAKQALCIRNKLLKYGTIVKVSARCKLLINPSSALLGLFAEGWAVWSSKSWGTGRIVIFTL